MEIKEGHIPSPITVLSGMVFWGMVAVVMVVSGCAKKDPDAWLLADPAYKGWHVEVYQNARVYYPDGHPRANLMPTIAERSLRAYTTISRTLGLPAPTDTLRVVYYTGMGQGKEMTGQDFPFVDSTGATRYWPPYAPAIAVAELVVKRWDAGQPKMRFLYHGLVALFDYSGDNYHRATAEYAADTFFVPLARLAVDTTVDVNQERWQSAEAASFCAYVIGNYGVDKLHALYRSELAPPDAFSQILGKPMDAIQAEWLAVAKMAAAQAPTAKRDSSSQK